MLTLFSVDDHIIEPPDVSTSRLPSKYRDAGATTTHGDAARIFRWPV